MLLNRTFRISSRGHYSDFGLGRNMKKSMKNFLICIIHFALCQVACTVICTCMAGQFDHILIAPCGQGCTTIGKDQQCKPGDATSDTCSCGAFGLDCDNGYIYPGCESESANRARAAGKAAGWRPRRQPTGRFWIRDTPADAQR